MKRLLFTILLLLFSTTIASAQCNGTFPNNTACGNISGARNLPGPVPLTSFPAQSPGGTNGQIQYNNSGNFGGFTAGQDCTVNTTTGAFNCTKTANTPFAPSATTDTTNATNITSGALAPSRFTDTTLQANGKSLYYNSGTGKLQYYWNTPVGPAFDLRDCMDVQYGVGAWNSTTDIEPALHTCLQTLRTNFGRGTIMVPSEHFTLASALPTFDLSGNYIIGQGSQATNIQYTVSNAPAFWWSGLAGTGVGQGGFTGGGMRGVGITLCCSLGVTTSTAILVEGSPNTCTQGTFNGTISGTTLTINSGLTGFIAVGQTVTGAGVTASTTIQSGSGSSWVVNNSQTVGPEAMTVTLTCNKAYQPDQVEFDDLYITADGITGGCGSYWNAALNIDGTGRTAPQGARVGSINNMQLFCSSTEAFLITNAVQWSIENIGTYVGNPGTGTGTDCVITGGGTSSTNTIQLSIVNLECGGTLSVLNSSYVYLMGRSSAIIWNSTTTFTNSMVSAPTVTGTIGLHSTVVNP